MKRPDIGDTFTNGIDNITDDGIGQIKVHEGHINVGPVTEDALGVEVTATLVEHDRAELHTDSIKPPVEETGSLKDSFTRETHVRIGKTFSAVINEITDDGHGLIYTRTGYIDLGPVTEDAEGEYVHALKLPGNAARVKSAKVQPANYIGKLENTFNFGFSLDFGDASAELHKRDHKTVGVIGNYASITEVRAGTTEHDGVDVSELQPGDVFAAEVLRISRAGNGIIETLRGHEMNIGQIPQHKVGDDVSIYYDGNTAHGKYLPRDQLFTAEIKRRSESGNGLLGEDTADLNIGPVTEDAVGERVTARKVKHGFGECVTVDARADGYEKQWIVDTLFDGEVPPGAEITVTLDRTNEHGNGIVEIGDDTINAGPVQPDVVKSNDNGVRVKMLNEEFAKCMDIEVRDTPYTLPETATAAYAEAGEIFHDVIDVITDDGYGVVITGHDQYVNIGPVEDDTVGERVHVEMLAPQTGRCLTESVRGNGYDEWVENDPEAQSSHLEIPGVTVATVENTGDKAGSTDQSEPGTVDRTREDSTVDAEPGETSIGTEEPRDVSGEEGKTASTVQVTKNEIEDPSNREPAENIDELRARAIQDSVEDVPTPTTTPSPSSSKQEYTRSAAIREYVKARADGYCEACGNPAPFKNTDGGPYLHAHHIHEISDSGSDTVDTVAAICPNCHYRIHHGEDGDEYNKSLLEKIQSIENTE
ncbi:HNH endonuclease [Natronomonas sp. F2-12]|uniref:HNH endonuclease n=1 Tax=Natronomonas aquatica TaxID=2841590 RepID=A0A9R1CVR1_9EURY|nr:HNH endonuclease [Natronomonas aquatica]MCQ4334760.1 HNH endonuclease [Natronomonas aquatica]